MLPVEDWEKAGPTQPNTIERTTIRRTRVAFMIGPSVAFRSDPVRTHGLTIKRLRHLEQTKNRHGARCPESADRPGDSSKKILPSVRSFAGRELCNLFPATPGSAPCHRAGCKHVRCDMAEQSATLRASAFRQGSHELRRSCPC